MAVSIAGICGYTLPGKSFCRCDAAVAFYSGGLRQHCGLFGVICGAIALLVHLSGLESFGIPYLAPFSGMRGAQALLRPRLNRQKFRDPNLHPEDMRNQR